MDDVVEVNNLQNLCRLCLSTDEPRSSIFGVQESSVPLAKKIQACLSIEVSNNDKLSTLICSSCLKYVNQWHDYKESCLASQEKLQRWHAKQKSNKSTVTSPVKREPTDVEIYDDNVEVIEMSEDESSPTAISPPSTPANQGNRSEKLPIEIKIEPMDEDDMPMGQELLLNPMAIGSKNIIEPDSTKSFKSAVTSLALKKKIRRGPHTHFRGVKVYKQRCPYCHVNLHSKNSYTKHIERYHNEKNHPITTEIATSSRNGDIYEDKNATVDDVEDELIEDLEDELVTLEKDAPLTQVQESIISQLKTFSCYACQQSFNDRRSTLNHIRQHMPDLRPYTCIACLTEFPDRSIYKLHCGASFECAMKIALVVPKHGVEKYFTCNMCLRPMPNRQELISHLSKHSDRQYEQLTSQTKSPPKLKVSAPKLNNIGPYRNGDPAHNHTCIYCSMIYRYKPNMIKHQDLCKKLPPEERISYRCAHCGMTFLVFKKFQTHLLTEHNKRDFVCFHCNAKYHHSSEFLIHYPKHRTAGAKEKFACAVCSEEFTTKSELTEHRNSHLKMKIFSCTVCRRMFGNSAALSEHMIEHGQDLDGAGVDLNAPKDDVNPTWPVTTEPSGRSTECATCGKVFANYPNLRRHIRSAHSGVDRYNCTKCSKTFTNEHEWSEHTEKAHKEAPAPSHRCGYCKKRFETREAVDLHHRNAHGITEDSMACDICSKEFGNITSLKIHRGHHFRRDSRLSITNMPHPMDQVQVEINDEPTSSLKSPSKGRRSFSNGSSPKAPGTPGNLQCQVCDDKFTDVQDLRKHLWDVHCAKHKPEKSFTGELQCELCTNMFADEKSLDEHMKWHKDNPILSDGMSRPVDISCEICGKYYSSLKALWKHKKLHKATTPSGVKFQSVKKNTPTQYPCPVCRKVFGNENSMKKHKAAAHYVRRTISGSTPGRKTTDDDNLKPKRPKLDFDIIRKAYNLGEPSSSSSAGYSSSNSSKKPVTCGICKKLLPSMSSLYKHRQNVHKQDMNKSLPVAISEEVTDDTNGTPCTGCDKIFSNLANMKQHYTKVHATGGKYYCNIDGCNEVFTTPVAKQIHEKSHMSMLYSCNICSRHVFTRGAMSKHLISDHPDEYQPSAEKQFYRKTDLNNYVVKGAEGRVCPVCSITYPNIRALKIHYLKIHEANS